MRNHNGTFNLVLGTNQIKLFFILNRCGTNYIEKFTGTYYITKDVDNTKIVTRQNVYTDIDLIVELKALILTGKMFHQIAYSVTTVQTGYIVFLDRVNANDNFLSAFHSSISLLIIARHKYYAIGQ